MANKINPVSASSVTDETTILARLNSNQADAIDKTVASRPGPSPPYRAQTVTAAVNTRKGTAPWNATSK